VVAYGNSNATVGVTSIPEFVLLLYYVTFLIRFDSIAHYTVSSLLIPFRPTTASGSERTIRVQGAKITFQALVDALGAAKGVKYETKYLPSEEAAAKEEEARLNGDEFAEMMWSIRPLIASGFGIADGHGAKLDNGLFDFIPETIEETFKRVYA
jgi:hypothetical protein